MTTAEFISKIARSQDVSYKQIEDKLNALLEVISEELISHNEVKIVDFGVFRIKHRAAKKGYNPYYQKSVDIPECDEPCFDPGKLLKEKIKES